MQKTLPFGIIIILLFLIGCSESEEVNEGELATPSISDFQVTNTSNKVEAEDFIYRLVTEKDKYATGESVTLYAELEYVGNEESVVIYHSASPFLFPIVEKTREYIIGYHLDEPLHSTTLQNGKPYRESYVRSGGYSERDEQDYINFIKKFWNDGFAEGFYIVEGTADFFIEGNDETTEEFLLETTVEFKVADS